MCGFSHEWHGTASGFLRSIRVQPLWEQLLKAQTVAGQVNSMRSLIITALTVIVVLLFLLPAEANFKIATVRQLPVPVGSGSPLTIFDISGVVVTLTYDRQMRLTHSATPAALEGNAGDSKGPNFELD
jgi:hypothetical protein